MLNEKTTPVIYVHYDRNKERFKEHEKETLRNTKSKIQYFDRFCTVCKIDIKKIWKTITETLTQKRPVEHICPMIYFCIYYINITKNHILVSRQFFFR